MDLLQRVTAVAAYVQQEQLPVNLYLADPERNPMHLPDHLECMRDLLSEIREAVHGTIPLPAYATHHHSTLRLIESLESLERGFSRDVMAAARASTARGDIPKDVLDEMMKSKLTDVKIGRAFGCSARTVARRRVDLGLGGRRAVMNSTPDEVLQEHIEEYLRAENRPKMGVEMTMGHLREAGIPHTREQVRNLMRAMNPDEYQARATQTARRREYSVPFVNSLWHIDGHHKLGPWKFAIHGGIDGKSHLITFMYASDNNRSDTVRALFLAETDKWGWPRRVRADYGGENLGVKAEMELRRGSDKAAFLQGKSTQNQRIERLWVDVRRGVVDKYRAIFFDLQDRGLLDPDNALHLFCLHHVYLPMINHSLEIWVNSWNRHSMSTPGLEAMTPIGQWYMGGITAQQNGFHIDYHPWPSEDDEEEAWQEYLANLELIDTAEYRVLNNEGDQQRHPNRFDQHVHVERFADYLPGVLFEQDVQELLQIQFGTPAAPEDDEGRARYANMLEFVETMLNNRAPE